MSEQRTRDWLAVSVAMLFPSLVTLTYFVILAQQPAVFQQTAYLLGKILQFGFPLLWVAWVLRAPLGWTPPTARGLPAGVLFGLLVLVAALGLYHGVLKPQGVFTTSAGPAAQGAADSGRAETAPAKPRTPAEAIRAKIRGVGIDRLWKFVALGVFYAVFHSLLEEYYWRWFVFGRLQRLCSLTPAIGWSSLAFMAHHVILMVVYFGWASPWAYFFSLSVAVGGAFWAWLYARSQTLYGPWLSHLLVDAAIFVIGYDLAKDLLS